MKPSFQSGLPSGRFPKTDYFFHSGLGEWRGGYSAPFDGDDPSPCRNFHNLNRAFLIESARERSKEMAVFAVVVLASAWPVIYMVITVVKLLATSRPLN